MAPNNATGANRGRGLDALFEGNGKRVQGVDTDLAALLDSEVAAAVTGSESPTKRRSASTVATAPAPSSSPDASNVEEQIDVPPLADQATPVDSGDGPAAPTPASPPGPMPSPGLSVPTPQPIAPVVTPVMPPTPPVDLGPSLGSQATVSTGEVTAGPGSTGTAPGGITTGAGGIAQPARPLPITQRFGAIIMEGTTIQPGGSGSAINPDLLPDLAGSKNVEPSGPGAEPLDTTLLAVATPRTEDEKTAILGRIDTDWQKTLHKQIDQLYKQVATEFSSPPELAERALTMLRDARQLLIEKPEEYVTAEYRTLQVQAMLDRMKESRKYSAQYGPRILAYETVWMLVMLVGLVFAAPLGQWLGMLGNMNAPTMTDVFPFWNTMMWGGIGGVIGALYHLWWHISDKQDFDRQYVMWYLVQPIMGLVLGGIVFLIVAGGFLALQVNLTDPNASTAARLLPYLMGVLGGFRQNFIYEQFDRLIGLFTPGARGNDNSGNTGTSGSNSGSTS